MVILFFLWSGPCLPDSSFWVLFSWSWAMEWGCWVFHHDKQQQAWQSTAFTFAASTGPCTRPSVWLPAPMDRQAQGKTRFQNSSFQLLPFTPQVATNALLASPHSCNHALCFLRISSMLSKQVEWVPWMLSKLTVRIKNVNWRECSFLEVNSNCSGVILNHHQQQRWFSQKWLFQWSEQERRYWENTF